MNMNLNDMLCAISKRNGGCYVGIIFRDDGWDFVIGDRAYPFLGASIGKVVREFYDEPDSMSYYGHLTVPTNAIKKL